MEHSQNIFSGSKKIDCYSLVSELASFSEPEMHILPILLDSKWNNWLEKKEAIFMFLMFSPNKVSFTSFANMFKTPDCFCIKWIERIPFILLKPRYHEVDSLMW